MIHLHNKSHFGFLFFGVHIAADLSGPLYQLSPGDLFCLFVLATPLFTSVALTDRTFEKLSGCLVVLKT